MILPAKVTRFLHHNVLRLDVAMHNSFRMGCRQRAGHLHSNFQRFIKCQPFIREMRAQRHTLDKLLGNEMERAFVSDLMNGDDVGVVQSRSGTRFLLEATQSLGVFGEMSGQ